MQLPYALRDPFRDSHFASAEYKSRWPEAPEYLAALQAGAETGLLDLSLIQTDKYEEALRQGISQAVGRRGSEGDPRRGRRRSGTRSPSSIGVDKQQRGLRGLGVEAQRLSELSDRLQRPAGDARPARSSADARHAALVARDGSVASPTGSFKYLADRAGGAACSC